MKKLMVFLIIFIALGAAPHESFSGQEDSPVKNAHLIMIESLFRDNGLMAATVKLDRNGRVLLGGGYKDSREVSIAFSLAQSVVGVKWTSPVTPEDVAVREWAQGLSALFPKKKKTALNSEKIISDGVKRKYALVVGVGRFKNDKNGKQSLKYAVNDARDVNEYLVDNGQYKKDNVTLLINEKATNKNIQQALEKITQSATTNDEVFIYFSSHGAPIYDGSLNIVTYETSFRNAFALGESSFPAKSLKSFLEHTRAGKVFIVLDVCYSGTAFKDIQGFYYAGSKSISFDDDNQGLSKTAMAKALLGSKDIVFENDVAMASDNTRNEGAKILISASDSGEKSWESDSLKASFFTHHFLQELRKENDFKSAFEAAKPKVTKNVKTEKKADQNPQAIASRKDWGI